MRRVVPFIHVAVFLLVLHFGARSVGPLPPMGSFLDPVRGVWAVARRADQPGELRVSIPTLGDSVQVLMDRRSVPHIFARNVEDAYRVLGYLVARDRLFQMEVQTRATAGRLTELVGNAALELDRTERRLGLEWSAERQWGAMDPDSRSARLIRAYAEGVNAYQDQMTAADLPLEYRLLNRAPLRWEPQHSIYLFKRMGRMLATDLSDLRQVRIAGLVGVEAAQALFPKHSPIQEPVQPTGEGTPRFVSFEIPPPRTPHQTPVTNPHLRAGLDGMLGSGRTRPARASNSWAVSPSRSASGFAMLAGDLHLDLSLPSIWYEVHVVVPDSLDVYGATFVGVPAVAVGFNRDVAWSFTNGQDDVLDFYREVFDDADQPTRYHLDGEMVPLEVRVEEYYGRSGDLLAVDTVRHTHRGPLLDTEFGPLSMRWAVLDPVDALEPFTRANRARSVAEWMEDAARLEVPAQNGMVADRAGNIGVQHGGSFPIRPDGSGREIESGMASANDWEGEVPASDWPRSVNPDQGFLVSANQEPVDPRQSDLYLGSEWWEPWRALQINRLLRADSSVSPDEMRRFQIDPWSYRAHLFVPRFLEVAERTLVDKGLDSVLVDVVSRLAEWDRRYTRDNEAAVLFEIAMTRLEDLVWDELVSPGEERRVATPGESILNLLFDQPESPWWDIRATEAVETRDRVVLRSLEEAYREAVERHGDPTRGGWRWDRVRRADIPHLTRLPSLSALDVAVDGGTATNSPLGRSTSFGASWRMVVQLGSRVRAWVAYPGGRSGNPISPWYDNGIPGWAAGELVEVEFPESPDDMPSDQLLSRFYFGGVR